MNVTAIGSYHANNYRKQNVNSPAFKGALTEKSMSKVLNMLGDKNTEIYEKFNKNVLKKIIDSLLKKYSPIGVRSVGVQIIGKKELPSLLGSQASRYNFKDKVGICVAVGDKYGPIENWGRVYESKIILATEKELKAVMN